MVEKLSSADCLFLFVFVFFFLRWRHDYLRVVLQLGTMPLLNAGPRIKEYLTRCFL